MDISLERRCWWPTNSGSEYYTSAGELGTDIELGTIEGIVTLQDGEGSVEEVQITADGIFTYPDASGSYSLQIIPGNYDVTAFLEEYAEQTVEDVEVFAGEVTSGIDFDLTAVANEPNLTIITKLIAAFPNPFNPQTTIEFELAQPQTVKLGIWNTRGRKITSLVNKKLAAGRHQIVWNGKDSSGNNVASGVYYCRMQANQNAFTRKLLLLK